MTLIDSIWSAEIFDLYSWYYLYDTLPFPQIIDDSFIGYLHSYSKILNHRILKSVNLINQSKNNTIPVLNRIRNFVLINISSMQEVIINVPDMQSRHCQTMVINAVVGVDGIHVRNVESGILTIAFISDNLEGEVIKAIERAGYTVSGIGGIQ
ncbi:heavy-metal-associated domain-containing protein [Polluticaenibacter yanchengensis]|uniref:Heavy-metal-associated domain-containing protein n=1 Tax=Polluticaenibacter yanchengensis TaxID=3014562 RepID=A0ABT4UPB8_9BACT|nr:heavy-metal-associated domain-containing protein [Chitinophagaceae bacterium LY-5]